MKFYLPCKENFKSKTLKIIYRVSSYVENEDINTYNRLCTINYKANKKEPLNKCNSTTRILTMKTQKIKKNKNKNPTYLTDVFITKKYLT